MTYTGLLTISVVAIAFLSIACASQQDGLEVLYRPFPRVEPPETFPDHPRLFLNQPEIDELKAAIAADPAFKALVDEKLDELREAAEDPQLPSESIGGNLEIANQAASFGVAYVITGEREFAEAAAAILKKYAEVFPQYEPAPLKGLATSSALEECVWGVDAAAAYDLVYNAGVLTDEEKLAIEHNVLRASARVLIECNHAYRSNWRIRANGGVMAMAFAIGDRELIDEAFNGFRNEEGMLVRDGFVHQMAWSVLADGIYYERSQSYSEEIGDAFAHLLESARHSGIDLWNHEFDGSDYDVGADRDRNFGPSQPKTVRHAYDAVLYRAFGNGTLAKVANSYWDHLSRRDGWSAAWRAYGDDHYAWPLLCDPDGWLHDLRDLLFIPPKLPAGTLDFAADRPLGVTGQFTNGCTFLPNGGYTVLRQDTSRDAASVAVTFGDFANGHCQADQLSLVVYAAGRQILPDTKYFRYIDPHLTWSKQTISHNTVTVDGISQKPQLDVEDMWVGPPRGEPVHGRAKLFHAGDEMKAVRADCITAQDGVTIDRTVVLVDSIIVDFFRCRSGEEHQYDYALHVDGQRAMCTAALSDPEVGPLSDALGYRHIVDLRRSSLDGTKVDLAYDDRADGPQVHLSLLPSFGEAELILGNGMEGLEGERAEVIIVRKTATDVNFVSVIDPAATGKRLPAQLIGDLPAGVLGVEITRPDGSKDIVLSADAAKIFTYAGQTFTGQVVLLRDTVDGDTEIVDQAK